MSKVEMIVSDLACWLTALLFVVGLVVLAVRLKEVQLDESAAYNYANSRQSVRKVQTDGERGMILDRHGGRLACNRQSLSIVCSTTEFQRRTWNDTVLAISQAVERVSAAIGQPFPVSMAAIRRHVNQSLAMPLVLWRDVDHVTQAKFFERMEEFPGFSAQVALERWYPQGSLAAHLLGYVGRGRSDVAAGDEKFNFYSPEMRGRSGIEAYYDEYIRGVPGEKNITVDARGFAISETMIVAPRHGPDLYLTIDTGIQRAVEAQLADCKGACVVLDPQNGDVLAMASAPTYNPNRFVPVLSQQLYDSYAKDPEKPLLNRATGGAYAPGSTFKPITALAGLALGYPEDEEYECCGVFQVGSTHLHCARRWGHGLIDLRHALKESCNTFFCNLGCDIGTNALIKAAREFGLGEKTGIDFGIDMAGVVPTAEWKENMYHEKWYQGDLAQMAFGQGMLLASPLQMARVAGALGTGYLVTPHLKYGQPPVRRRLSFTDKQLRVVRDGMEMVVDGGTGKRGGKDVKVKVAGKTGTAEIGKGERRRKNTWFIAYAPAERPVIAIAMVIENGASGGVTTAPKVGEILKDIFNGR